MVTYIVRRLVTAVLILFGASFIVYQLTAMAGDPLADLRDSNAGNKEELIRQRTALLDLNTPAPVRYFKWLGGAVQCLVPLANTCDLGSTLHGEPVTEALGRAMGQTILLVTGATVLAIVVGITLGIVTGLRQYSSLDYSVTLMAFLFFSLPIFWVAVLLKEFGAIQFNDFLVDPVFSPWSIVLTALLMGVVAVLFTSGTLKRRSIGFVLGAGGDGRPDAGALRHQMVRHARPRAGPAGGLRHRHRVPAHPADRGGAQPQGPLLGADTVPLGLVSYYVLNPVFAGFGTWQMVAGAWWQSWPAAPSAGSWAATTAPSPCAPPA